MCTYIIYSIPGTFSKLLSEKTLSSAVCFLGVQESGCLQPMGGVAEGSQIAVSLLILALAKSVISWSAKCWNQNSGTPFSELNPLTGTLYGTLNRILYRTLNRVIELHIESCDWIAHLIARLNCTLYRMIAAWGRRLAILFSYQRHLFEPKILLRKDSSLLRERMNNLLSWFLNQLFR